MNFFLKSARMKRRLAFIVLSSLLLLSGCGSNTSKTATANKDNDKLTIVTSFYPMYIMALNITSEIPGVEVINLTGPQTGCLHDYQLTPENIKTLQKADIFIVNGAGTESFLDKVTIQQKDIKIISATKNMTLIKGTAPNDFNPHVWVSVSGAIQEVENITSQLSALDPSHADKYQENSKRYVTNLENLRLEMHKQLDSLPNRNIVSFHEAFPYFAQEFNLNVAAVVEREPGSEPSAAELAKTIEIVRKSKVKALFIEPQYPPGAARIIAKDTGSKVYTLDPAVSGPVTPDAYINIMEKNLEILSEALK